ncbi:TIGR01440 family protein [Priestia flexa]|uniref:UPF0340 protein AS180_05710 n=1 Tax=Priestia veravalensis TaxID=1414648 RepID=A0A0V8JP25_9BACI|nr:MULTISPECIES: TIGR01440 family protein [Bacillaceae]KSU88805.1 hypothetical protein AS180_05710 [Priestia veravalensis]KZB92367.1 TIGR01440 family protein [Bacillus sp. VT 712]MEC0667916.1 TIGR01440 family protein [Priestia flexa]MED3823585.1 TIGR01440 family protein [Priestia flexa]UZW67032.1 TIGR01440 family protein [Priestia flexa]
MSNAQDWARELEVVLADFSQQVTLQQDSLFVVGCSTSEVVGERIGTSGTEEAAEVIYGKLQEFAKEKGIDLAFQCCEHLNRALVVERKTALKQNLDLVTVIPVRKAGGAMATYAYHHFNDPVIVEFIKADAGIDIGDTFIGMHLKHVAVPVRCSLKQIGQAHMTIAYTRPKLIGGPRAIYERL